MTCSFVGAKQMRYSELRGFSNFKRRSDCTCASRGFDEHNAKHTEGKVKLANHKMTRTVSHTLQHIELGITLTENAVREIIEQPELHKEEACGQSEKSSGQGANCHWEESQTTTISWKIFTHAEGRAIGSHSRPIPHRDTSNSASSIIVFFALRIKTLMQMVSYGCQGLHQKTKEILTERKA